MVNNCDQLDNWTTFKIQPRSYTVSCYHCTTNWKIHFACFYLLCYYCCLSGAVLSLKIVHYASMLLGWDVQSCGISFVDIWGLPFVVEPPVPSFQNAFSCFFEKKIHGTSEEIATLQALKRHGTVNILKVVQAVYIFSFVDLCIWVTFMFAIGHQINADAVIFTK